jgi:NTP pyrophosphatase (non-canonical NTP hydrolase)
MNFLEYQAAANRTAAEAGQEIDLLHAAVGLATEAGEYTSEVKRIVFYDKPISPEMVDHMAEELGDTLWYIALACRALGVSLERVAERNIAKLDARFPRGEFSPAEAEARADKGGLPHTES